MLKDIVAIKPLEGYQLLLRFEDSIEGVVDISQLIQFSGIFAPLQDRAYFTTTQIHPELDTIVWENGADLDRSLCKHRRSVREGLGNKRDKGGFRFDL